MAFVVRGGRADDDPRGEHDADDDQELPDVARQARDRENRARAARRARGRMRRYVVANGLTRLVSLTFAPLPGRDSSPGCGQAEVPLSSAELVHRPGDEGLCVVCGRPMGADGVVWAMGRAARFFRRLRERLGGEAFPYAVVPEFHKDGHVHLHALLGQYVPKNLLGTLWGHGWVDVRRFDGAEGGREAARKAAAYACKYVTKAFEDAATDRHRYEVGQGFQPAVVKRSGYGSLEAAVGFALDHGQRLIYAVHSSGLEDYDGPPFLWVTLEPDGPPG